LVPLPTHLWEHIVVVRNVSMLGQFGGIARARSAVSGKGVTRGEGGQRGEQDSLLREDPPSGGEE